VDELAKLRIDDIDWINGTILIRGAKTRWERRLPLAQDLAEALLRYLRHVRPAVNSRELFVQWNPPFHACTGGGLSKIVKRSLLAAGIAPRRCRPHLFRHSVASAVVNQGGSFKDAADLLGHQSLRTTGIYAKLSFDNLASIALPWPGGES
jgi:integrase